MWFLGSQCEKAFLEQVLSVRGDILKWAENAAASDLILGGRVLFAAMASWSLFPETTRTAMVANIREHSITWLDAKPLTNEVTRQIFKSDEFKAYTDAFREAWLSDISSVFSEFGRFSSEDEVGMYNEFKENLQAAQAFFGLEQNDEWDELYADIDARVESLGGEDCSYGGGWSPRPANKSEGAATSAGIFRDVDD